MVILKEKIGIPKDFNEFLKWSKENSKKVDATQNNKNIIIDKKENENKNIVIIKKDTIGNKLYHKNFNFYIKLKNLKEKREIGYFKDGKFITTRKKSKHLYRKLNAWGFNYDVIKFLIDTFDEFTIIVEEKEGKKQYIFKINQQSFKLYKKNVLNFKLQGFEPQMFIPIDKFEVNRKIKF